MIDEMRNLAIGTVSHGTLRPEDLAPAFYHYAKSHGIDVERFYPTVEMIEDGSLPYDDSPALGTTNGEVVDETIGSLIDAINEELPDYLYFGTLEGDGSDYGVWPQAWCDEDLALALLEADRAALGDSNDAEIAALRDALDLALSRLEDAA